MRHPTPCGVRVHVDDVGTGQACKPREGLSGLMLITRGLDLKALSTRVQLEVLSFTTTCLYLEQQSQIEIPLC
jgi:hypothetical protein